MPGSSRFTPLHKFQITNYLVLPHNLGAGVSVPANFAEGFKKLGVADKLRFNIDQGSLQECRYYLILASDLGYGDSGSLKRALEEISRMLDGYSNAIRRLRN